MTGAHGGSSARQRVVADVDRMCSGEGEPPVSELSDPAALLVATGLVDPQTRQTVIERLHQRLPMPSLGGYHLLRLVEEQRHEARRIQAAPSTASVVRFAARTRLMDLDRRHTTQRAVFVRGAGVFAQRVKDIRLDRRRGVHLDPVQRAALFDALASTPTLQEIPVVPRTIGELGVAAAARGQREVGRVVVSGRVRAVMDTLPSIPAIHTVRRHLPEMYTALLMEAGGLYDRLQAAYHLGGRAVEEVRLQFDSESELAGISADLCGLRRAAGESGRREGHGRFSADTGLGAAIDGIWAEIVDRVVALRELVESVEGRAEAAAAEARRMEQIAVDHGIRPTDPRRGPSPVDAAAEQLVARSGDRMISTEAMRRLRGQIDPGSGPAR